MSLDALSARIRELVDKLNDRPAPTATRSDLASSTEATTEAATDSNFEPWLKKAAHAPAQAYLPRLPQVGEVIGEKYRIEEELGQGGMGAVFRATHIVSDKAVALKWMLSPATDQRALQRFTREARAAGRIDHPNVVDVYDIGHEGDAGYLVMELLRGESFRSRLARGVLDPGEVIDLLLPAMQGVAAAHREGVIHRDLKPDNIFLCQGRDGEPRPAKVLDFGISTITSPDQLVQTALTTDGVLLGTPSYIAPEQIEAAATADVRTDVYAFGVILYEALTGRVPFAADNYLRLALAITKGEAPSPRTLRPEISPELEQVVLQSMHKDPAKRPQSIDELIALVTPHANGAAAAVQTPGEAASLQRTAHVLPHRRARLGAGAASLAFVALAVAGWLWFRGVPPRAITPPPPPPRVDPPAQVQAQPAAAPSPQPQAAPPIETPEAPVEAPAKPTKSRRKERPATAVPHVEEPPSPPLRPGRAGRIRADEL